MQRSLSSHEWPGGEQIRVRMGMHAGEASEGTTGLVGLDVHKAARVAGAAHGGQVLLSESVAALVREFLPDGVSLRDLGLHRLKDLGRPERIFQLDIPGLADQFPPIRSLDNPDLENNLPAQLSSFVGRETELAEVGALVEASRLVTLTGAGGSGKTRLALQVAAELLDGSGEGVWLVDLAPVADPGLVAATVAQAIGVREQPGSSVAETLIEAIGTRRLLILLDNCEHLIDSCAKLTDSLLRSCPRIHVLATSREPLTISGERVFRVPSLRLPGLDDDLLAMGESEAVRLFLDRASDHSADFILDDRNSRATASICRRLDGMPLAIELAAARVASMDVSEIEAGLDKRFSLLTKGTRNALPRQQTLRALVDWSYELLTEHERAALSRLSVFAGGWDLPAAEAVVGADDSDVFAVADVLGSLVDKSLVQTDITGFGLRYRLLETIRQFAAEKLAERDAENRNALAGHANFFLELAERAAPELRGSQQAEWLERLEADHDNFRAAIDSLLVDPAAGQDLLRMVVALSRVFRARHPREGVEVFTSALSSTAGERPSALKAEALGVLGDIMEGRDRRKYLEEGLAMARSFGNPSLVAALLTWPSWCAFQKDDVAGCAVYVDEAVAIARGVGDPGLLGRALTRKASACPWDEGIDAHDTGFEEAISLLRLAGDRSWEALALCNLATF
jgi:predicted ATPase